MTRPPTKAPGTNDVRPAKAPSEKSKKSKPGTFTEKYKKLLGSAGKKIRPLEFFALAFDPLTGEPLEQGGGKC